MNNAVDYKPFKLKRLQDPEYAKGYLEVCIEEYYKDNDLKALLNAIHDIAIAQKGMTELSKETGLNRQGLYKSFAEDGNPRFETVMEVLASLGFKLKLTKI